MARAARTNAGPADGDDAFVQLLAPDGTRVKHDDYALDIPDDDARGLYRDMTMIRRVDVEATSLQRQGQLALWAPLRGQEAAQIGAGRALEPDDFCFPGYREHGIGYCRGISPIDAAKSFRQVTNGGWDPYLYNYAEPSIVIGNNAVNAVGYAMGVQHDGAESAVLACIGDGAMSQGDIAESFVWAGGVPGARRLPAPEQPLGDLRAHRAPEPHPAVPACRGLRVPGRPRGRQRRVRDARREPRRARPRT